MDGPKPLDHEALERVVGGVWSDPFFDLQNTLLQLLQQGSADFRQETPEQRQEALQQQQEALEQLPPEGPQDPAAQEFTPGSVVGAISTVGVGTGLGGSGKSGGGGSARPPG